MGKNFVRMFKVNHFKRKLMLIMKRIMGLLPFFWHFSY